MTDSPLLLEITTALSPPKKIKLDGEDYDVFSSDHLNPEQEAEAQALFARFGVLQMELEHTSDTNQGKALAERIRKTRIRILTLLTSIPKAKAETLPLTVQAKILEAVNRVMEADEDSDGEAGGDED